MVELSGLQTLARIIDPVARRFVDAGHRIYLVGGVVRDLELAGDQPFDTSANDIDLTTDALPTEIKRLLAPVADALWAQGERFGTIGANHDGQALEITTHRAEAYDPDSRKPVVSFGRDLDQDLSRRDFTINAMAIELPSLAVHDPYDGRRDLAAKRLRTPLSPEISFSDDPLRMMRAARFISRFELTPTAELVAAARELSDRLAIVSVERVADELERLLLVPDPTRGLRFLAETGLLGRIVVGYHDADQATIDRSVELAAMTAPLDRSEQRSVRRAGLLWPLRSEAAGALARLRYSNSDRQLTGRLIDGVAAALVAELDHPAGRRIVAAVGFGNLPLLLALAANLEAGAGTAEASAAKNLRTVLTELQRTEDLSDLDSPLSGAEVMAVLGLEPGPDVGRARRFLTELRLDRGPMSGSEAAELLESWWHAGGDRN